MIEFIVTLIISTSSDFRVHAHGGYFVDMRDGGETGRQMMFRNPGTRAEVDALIAELREAASRQDKPIRFEIIDHTV